MSISMSTCLSCLSIHVYLSPSKFTRLSPKCMCSCLSLCLPVSPSLCLSPPLYVYLSLSPLCASPLLSLLKLPVTNLQPHSHTGKPPPHTLIHTYIHTHLLLSLFLSLSRPTQQFYVMVSEVHMVNNKKLFIL